MSPDSTILLMLVEKQNEIIALQNENAQLRDQIDRQESAAERT